MKKDMPILRVAHALAQQGQEVNVDIGRERSNLFYSEFGVPIRPTIVTIGLYNVGGKGPCFGDRFTAKDAGEYWGMADPIEFDKEWWEWVQAKFTLLVPLLPTGWRGNLPSGQVLEILES